MDWACIQEVGNILIIVDAGSGWIEAFICGDRLTEKVIHCLSTIFGRFGVPLTLDSDNAEEFINDKVVTWLQAQGCTKLESPIYNPRSNGLAERAVQAVKKAMGHGSCLFVSVSMHFCSESCSHTVTLLQ